MGNHPSKERPPHHHNPHLPADQFSHASYPTPPDDPSSAERPHGAPRRTSRHDLSIFGLPTRSEIDPSLPEARKETKAEREARKLDKERALREKERERSVREEGVDGGYLVTLGVYTGTEDFAKPIVRQLMIERRLAPFWKGLNDHNDSWADNQLIAAASGLSIPPPVENTDLSLCSKPRNLTPPSVGASTPNIVPQAATLQPHLNLSIHDSPSLSPSRPAFGPPSPSALTQTPQSALTATGQTSPPDWISQSPSSALPFFRGKAKTLASLTSLSRNNSQPEMAPQEMQLPRDPYVNGQPLEVVLYRNASECPICFLYYPPYLNKTRCCDQAICSECFVQIKRPDPHPPEHHDDEQNTDSPENPPLSEEYQLVSEPATCPYCKVPEFGITYEPPPFRRGLAYANQPNHFKSAMSSSSSISSMGVGGHSRRRNQSLSVDSPFVITTDKIRPDWAKKLADARAHALRRAAAATALHNAAYVMGNTGEGSSRFGLGRRRRTFFGSDGEVPSQSPFGQVGALLAAADRQQAAANRAGDSQTDLFPGRSSSRRTRIDTLEELMMMEAIRQSIATEEERKKKEDKDAAKQQKKQEKQAKKEAKEAKRSGKLITGTSSTPLGASDSSPSPVETEESSFLGKGKAVERAESSVSPQSFASPQETHTKSSLLDPNAGVGTVLSSSAPALSPSPLHSRELHPHNRQELRQLSLNNSSASSFSDLPTEGRHRSSSIEFGPNGSLDVAGPSFRSETPPGEMINFQSLDEIIDDDAERSQALNLEVSTLTASTLTATSEAPTIVASVNANGESLMHKLPSTAVVQEESTDVKGKGRSAVA